VLWRADMAVCDGKAETARGLATRQMSINEEPTRGAL
jgi:hypothetical protein